MTTLRRELRKIAERILKTRIEEILYDRIHSVFALDIDEFVSNVTEELLDALNSKPKIDLAKSDPAWGILFGENTDNSKMLFEKEAFDTFERDMQTPGNWFWFPAKTSDEKVWKYFRDFVVKVYAEDNKAFEKYQTWRTQPYARGAMSNLAIKRNPENFPASWSDFLASSAMYGKKPVQRPVDLDDNGIPRSY